MNLYTQSAIINPESLDDLRYHSKSGVDILPSMLDHNGKGVYDTDVRVCDILKISHLYYPDICQELCDFIESHDSSIAWYYEVREFNYLCYKSGGHFVLHRDWLGHNNNDPFSNRHFTTITLIDKSDDIEGGNLLIWRDPKEEPDEIVLEVNETVIFDARLFHQVTPIEKGTREVLVAWIYLKPREKVAPMQDGQNKKG
jgi:predicted 2-oxoglutarate/Fe(II)-dependent dioxygenase YbiX|tara:strand:+ start:3726 stop:4322 length:597 start_codon:yes stop_codon:yes gene_type:complete